MSGAFRLILSGSRDATEPAPVWRQLDLWLEVWNEGRGARPEWGSGALVLVEGEARGVDRFGVTWARSRGVAVDPYPAAWWRWGNAAGGIRNQAMCDAGAALCLAFPTRTSIGTWDCVRRAKAAGIAVVVHPLQPAPRRGVSRAVTGAGDRPALPPETLPGL